MRIGVLALQGAFREHIQKLTRLGVTAVEVRLPEDLAGLDGLIIPGGESTTIGKLRDFAARRPVWGTCAGMIFMARQVGQDQPLLGVMDITVERNAFGRQVDSFEVGLDLSQLLNGAGQAPFPAVFIRAPRLLAVHGAAHIVATLADGTAVAAQEGHWLVTSFHPELTEDDRLHRYFIDMVRRTGNTAGQAAA
jgi:5'-phosphate synthase pdxT subunit